MTRLTHVGAVIVLALGLTAAGPCGPQPIQLSTPLHYAGNGDFDPAGNYTPGTLGFNMADVSSRSMDNFLPSGLRSLIWVGTCNGADATFQATINTFVGDPHPYGFYLMDEPTPTTCPPANLAAESDYIHATLPGLKTFIIMINEGSPTAPSYPDYTPANSHLDQVGLDPYPCRTDAAVQPCDYSVIPDAVNAANVAGWSTDTIVPVYQAFGNGAILPWVMPTADQATQMLQTWASVTPTPPWDYAYSWGLQYAGETALSNATPDVQAVFSSHNRG